MVENRPEQADAEASQEQTSPHKPVLLAEVLEYLAPATGDWLVDGTFGAGGYTSAILDAAPGCKVVAFDRDPTVRPHADRLSRKHGERFRLIESPFGDMEARLSEHEDVPKLDGIVLDIGVSSMQLDQPERGFSFKSDGPLDMRMGDTGPTAADLVNTAEEAELARILFAYGEERRARAVARRIVQRRGYEPFERTSDLADVIRSVVRSSPKDKIDPATRSFQALRIAVNDELGELERALEAAPRLLKPGGRLVVVTFHSLEDRIVKRFMKSRSQAASRGNRHLPPMRPEDEPTPDFELLTRRPVKAGDEEIAENPRARSAHLRAVRRN
ncbi:MAG: 16S rRNA (cytosine(1402)-N(4))-methyltransferase RsmH [Alphaproteobacteria bacterium]